MKPYAGGILLFALLGAGGLFTNVASSKGLHLKFFLYPPHETFLLWHCWHDGFVSSHFNRFALHVMQPGDTISLPPLMPLITLTIEEVPIAASYHFGSWIAWAL